MSKTINLVEYEMDEQGRLLETKFNLIETAFISPSLYNIITKDHPTVPTPIFESSVSGDHYSIDCFDSSEILNIIGSLEDIFLRNMKSDSEKLLISDAYPAQSNSMTTSADYLKVADLEESIARFREITNLIHLFKLKKNQYSALPAAVLKVG